MVWPWAAAAIGGAGTYMAGSAEADLQRNMQQTQWGFQDQLRNQFGNDPLMAMAMRNVTQQSWDPREMMKLGQEQIGAVGRRRSFDAKRNLAQYGFQPGSAQHDFMQQGQQMQQNWAEDDLKGLIAMQQPMAQMQDRTANALGYSQAMMPSIQMAAGGLS